MLQRHRLLPCIAAALLLAAAWSVAAPAKDDAPVSFSFAFPEGEAIDYELSLSEETNWSGMVITTNQTYKIAASLRERSEEGGSVVELAFPEVKTYRMIDDDIQDWKPPLTLDGKSIVVTVGADGEIGEIKPGANIPGMRSPAQLRPYAQAVFSRLPGEPKAPGDSWEIEIRKNADYEDLAADSEETPVFTGKSVYKFKKIEKKHGIEVAFFEVESRVEINRETAQGTMTGENNGKTKVYVALDGCWVVESKAESEFKGRMVSDDGNEHDIVLFTWTEMKYRK